ncbi:MAG: ABC transporter substrate-binding protein [Gordonia sp. (in: high G+C Gram-positive bacteria)]|uniref:ABC transporter substrate-binding protein n=1 Tax=Gordonia sp. (in: high G+C Gram-positive bacteria) TaxID=84139 RepID=UPI0039E2E2DE
MRFPKTALSAVALTCALTLSTTACSSGDDSDSSNAVASVENCDQRVSVSAPIERAIAVNQPAVELLLSLGLQDRMVGYAQSDDGVLPHLEAARGEVKPFDTEFPSFESVLEREPDFVYATFDYAFTSEGIADREKFGEMGVATYQSPSECGGQDADRERMWTLDDLYSEVSDIATLFQVPEKGEELTESLRSRANAATSNLNADDVTLGWWYASTKTPYFAGCCGAPGLMTTALGAKNAFADSKQYWPEVSWESVLDRDPTVLILADLDRGDDGDSAAAKIEFLESDPVASRLTAVKNKRYIILNGTTMDPSIRNVAGTEEVAAGLRRLGVVK